MKRMSNIISKSIIWLFGDDKSKIVIIQQPNWQLIGAGVFWVIQFIAGSGKVYAGARAAFIIFITFWAYEEIVHGANRFRRILGVTVLAVVYMGLYVVLEAV